MKIKILLLGIIVILTGACSNPDFGPVNDSSQSTSTTTVEVSNNLYSNNYCNSFFEGIKSFTVTITVDVYENGDFKENYYTHVFQRDNDDSNFNNFTFNNVEVPDTGSYLVSVTYNTNDCFVCCDVYNGCSATDANGTTWYDKGHPYYRGVKWERNATSVPSTIYINPNKLCF